MEEKKCFHSALIQIWMPVLVLTNKRRQKQWVTLPSKSFESYGPPVFPFLAKGQEPLVRQIPKWRSCRAKTKPFQDSYVIWAGKKKHFCCSVSRKELGSLVRAQLSLNWPVCLSVCLKCPLTSLGEGFHPSLKLTECDKPWIWKPNQWWDTFKSWCSALLVDLWLDKPYILLSTNLC